MDNTIKQTVIFEGGDFYSLTPAGRHRLSAEQADSLKPGFVLMIADTELFYTTMEFPDAPKRKLNLFISNFLMGSFPSQLCEKFCYVSKDDRILIGIFSGSFTENFEQYEGVFSKASQITSPFAAAYMQNDSFSYSVDGLIINVEDGLITGEEQAGDLLGPDWSVTGTRLTLPFVRHRLSGLNTYRIPAAVLLACYLIFMTGSCMRLSGNKEKLEHAQTTLTGIYKKAGVANSRDPYGSLLSKAGRSEGGEKFRTIFILEKISSASNSSIITESIDIKENSITFQGSSEDYAFLEEFTKKLNEITGKDVQLIDTVKQDSGINFTLRFEI